MLSDNNQRLQLFDLLPPPEVNGSDPKDEIESVALYNYDRYIQLYTAGCIEPWKLDDSSTTDVNYVPEQLDAFQVFDFAPATPNLPSTDLLDHDTITSRDSFSFIFNNLVYPLYLQNQNIDLGVPLASIGDYEKTNVNSEDNASDSSLRVTKKRSMVEDDSTRCPKRRNISSDFAGEEHAKLSPWLISQIENPNKHEMSGSSDDKGDATHAIFEIRHRNQEAPKGVV